jgi:hypothetical protein
MIEGKKIFTNEITKSPLITDQDLKWPAHCLFFRMLICKKNFKTDISVNQKILVDIYRYKV